MMTGRQSLGVGVRQEARRVMVMVMVVEMATITRWSLVVVMMVKGG
jgi:hypothetical protein